FGRARAQIIYVTSWLSPPERAHLNLTTRFRIEADEVLLRQNIFAAVVKDGERENYRTDPVHAINPKRLNERNYSKEMRRAADEAQLWLEARYPEWRDPGAYWVESPEAAAKLLERFSRPSSIKGLNQIKRKDSWLNENRYRIEEAIE